MAEQSVIGKIEARYLKRERRRNTKQLFEDIDVNWYWDEDEIRQYIRMWKANIEYRQIMEHFEGRKPVDYALLHVYLGAKGRIEPRERGLQ